MPVLSPSMAIQALFKGKERGSYVLLLLLLIVLIAITLYLSDLSMRRIEQEIPKVGEVISPVPVSPPAVFNHYSPSQKHH